MQSIYDNERHDKQILSAHLQLARDYRLKGMNHLRIQLNMQERRPSRLE